MTSARGVLRRHGLDALGVLAAIGFALPSLGYPFGMDQPLHWYIGQRWLEGEMPYVSGLSTKPPGVFAVHALATLALGDHQWTVRVVDLAFVLAGGALVATFRARRLDAGRAVDVEPRRAGELGAACVAVSALAYTFFDWNALGHPDLWQGVFMVMAGWVVVRAPDGVVSPRRAFAAGAVACVAVTFKHVALVSGVAFGVVVVGLALSRRQPREALVGAAAYTAGVALVLGLTLLPFLLTGTLDAFYETMVDYILRYAGSGTEATAAKVHWLQYGHGLVPVLVAFGVALGGVALAGARGEHAERWIGLGALLAMLVALVNVLGQGRAQLPSFEYYWLSLVPALGLGVAYGVRRLTPRSGARQLAILLALAIAGFLAEPGWLTTPGHSYLAEWRAFVAEARGEITLEERERVYFGNNPRLDNYPRQRRVAEAVRERARPGDTLCIDGFFGAIHQLTGLRCTSRHLTPPDPIDAHPRWRREYERLWSEAPPTFYVTTSGREALIAAREREGYVRHDLRDGPSVWFVLLERR